MVSERLNDLLTALILSAAPPGQLAEDDLVWLQEASDEEIEALLQTLCSVELSGVEPLNLAHVVRRLVFRLQPWMQHQRRRLSSGSLPLIVDLYSRLGADHPARPGLLQLLSSSAQPTDLAALAELLVGDPPPNAEGVMLAVGPLLQHTDYDPAELFPRLLDAVGHQAVAASVLDLANFLSRRQLVETHPAAERKGQLMLLLSEIVRRLEQIEEDPDNFAQSREALIQQIDDGVALAVALCDALALIGDEEAIGKLYQAFEVRHRRVHTEAAAALARFGEETGEQALLALAAEPVARLRVLAYAEELGFAEKIDDQYRTPSAQAEAELALWLAQPPQMGIPPTELELVDSQTLYWPGFDEPVECFLLRFIYRVGAGQYSNIGIAGPLTHAFAADLQDLPPDDIYAAFAGWHAEHDDIYQRDVDDLVEAQRVEVARLERRLRDDRFTDVQPVQLGMFLGDRVLVAKAHREGHAGIAVTDGRDALWFALRNPERPITAHEAICIYKGRRLLREFN